MIRRAATVRVIGLTAVAVTMAAGTALGGGASFALGSEGIKPLLSVSPVSGLVAGSTVTFHGYGFPPGVALRVEECDPVGAVSVNRCTAIADSLLLTDQHGSVSGTATIVTGPVGIVAGSSCPAGPGNTRCDLVLAPTESPGSYAATPISFAGPAASRPAAAARNPRRAAYKPAAASDRSEPAGPVTPTPAEAAQGGQHNRTGAEGSSRAHHRSTLAWPLWVAVMAGAAAGSGALQAARARRRRLRASAPAGG